jgi:hypothetical protein
MTVYQGGCSFLKSPDIFVNTSLSDYFGVNLININNCKEGASNTQIFRKALFSIMKSKFDFVLIGWTQSWRNDKSFIEDVIDYTNIDKLLMESYKNVLDSELGYEHIVGNSHKNIHCNFEPQGTDNVIMYTLILNQLLKLKNIPHLFITMGQLGTNILNNRKGWVDLIEPKNYYGEGNIVEKMSFSITNYFYEKHLSEGHGTPKSGYNTLTSPGYVIDNTPHLNYNGSKMLSKLIKTYIIENNIL